MSEGVREECGSPTKTLTTQNSDCVSCYMYTHLPVCSTTVTVRATCNKRCWAVIISINLQIRLGQQTTFIVSHTDTFTVYTEAGRTTHNTIQHCTNFQKSYMYKGVSLP